FPVSTGQEETRRDALETIAAIRELKRRYPEVHTTLGISNVSFGLNPAARQVLNSVFLHECVEAGLDSAIVHAARIMPIARIPADQRETALDLVYDRRRDGYDPLARLLELFAGVDAAVVKASRAAELAGLPLWERLKRRIIDGERNGLVADLDEALTRRPALEIVNDVLLDGMKTVGDLFGSGQMQLPFVLQSAEAMKASVAHLEPHMERSGDATAEGRLVLATVKGDVHDIGKNIVGVVLQCNNYEVFDLGVMVPAEKILDEAVRLKVDMVGLSGLITPSLDEMVFVASEMERRGFSVPLLIGGATTSRTHTAVKIEPAYQRGSTTYVLDASRAVGVVSGLLSERRPRIEAETRADYAKVREGFARSQEKK
ncbi:MAG: B12-binding domain-containing protein, partial [Mycobacterium sp.]